MYDSVCVCVCVYIYRVFQIALRGGWGELEILLGGEFLLLGGGGGGGVA